MNRLRHPPEPYLRSTTRAVAWSALFFAFLAFLTSGVTLFLTWRDGQLVRNAQTLIHEVREIVNQRRQEKGAAQPGKTDDSSGQQWKKLHERMGRIEEMVRRGDERAKYYLENLKDDFDALRKTSSSRAAEWLDEAGKTLQSAKEQIARNAPEAARKLRSLAAEMQKKAQSGLSGLKKENAPGAGRTGSATTGEASPAPRNPAAEQTEPAQPQNEAGRPDPAQTPQAP